MNQLSAAEQLVVMLRDALLRRGDTTNEDEHGCSIAYKYRAVAESANALYVELLELRDMGGEV